MEWQNSRTTLTPLSTQSCKDLVIIRWNLEIQELPLSQFFFSLICKKNAKIVIEVVKT